MIDFESVEQSLCDLLAPLRDRGILAMPLPDEPGVYGQPTGNGVVSLGIERVARGDRPSLDFKVQHRIYTIDIDIRLKRRRGNAGLSAIASEIERLLHGVRVPDLGTLGFTEYRVLGRAEAPAAWVARMQFGCDRMDERRR